jgi:uncharacterized membrane protein
MNFKINPSSSEICWICFIAVFSALTLFRFKPINFLHPEMEIIAFIVLSIAGIIIIDHFNTNRNLYKTAFLIILIFGLIASVTTPILHGPDEVEHFTRSEMTSRGQLIPEYENGSYKTIQSTFDLIEEGRIHTSYGFEATNDRLTVFKTTADTQPINNTLIDYPSAFAQNPFFGYLAPAVGIAIAKLLDLNAIWLVWLGRMFNVLLYATLSAIAIKKTPILKMPMLVFACLPLAIFLGATTSIDAFINGTGLVTMAWFFYMYKSPEGSLTKRDILIFTILTVLLGMAKVTCFTFILLLAIVPKANFKDERQHYLGFAAIILTALAAIAWVKFYANPGFLASWRANYSAMMDFSPARQADYIAHHMGETISELVKMPLYLPKALSFTMNFEDFTDTLRIIFVALIILFYPADSENLKSRIYALTVSLIFYAGTYLSFMLSWCEVGKLYNYYPGVQVRYFYPVLALLPFIFNIRVERIRELKLDSAIITALLVFISYRCMRYVILAY